MNTTQKVATIALALTLSLGSPSIVFANSLRAARQEFREEKKNLFEQFKENVGSKTAEIRRFLGERAAITSGEITAKTDDTLTIEKDGKTYIVNIQSSTQIRRRFWGKSELSEFSVGNTVNVIGLWADEAHTTINARMIRNISIQKRFGVFFGEVKSLLTNGWVMSTKSENRADQTVTVSSDTKFMNRRGETIIKTDVTLGHKVRVRGLWDKSLNTITEVTEVKDFSLPIQAEVTATVTPTP